MYQDFVNKINESPYKVCIAVTGGGQSFATEFKKYPGASKTIEDIQDPYGRVALNRFCGKVIEKSTTAEVARLMATRSFAHCCEAIEPEYAVGIGLTCSLASKSERKDRTHKIFIAVHCHEFTHVREIELKQGLSREQEEEYCCRLIMSALGRVSGVNEPLPSWNVHITPYELRNITTLINRNNIQTSIYESNDHLVIVPGSFNPFHDGHREMLELAEEIIGIRPIVELTTVNADKGTLDYIEVQNRFDTIPNLYSKVMTDARTFLDKARYFAKRGRRLDFVIGTDTWNRLLDPKYAGPMKELYNEFIRLDVRFLVFNRDGYNMLSDEYMNMLLIINNKTTNFNVPISSTAIREGKQC